MDKHKIKATDISNKASLNYCMVDDEYGIAVIALGVIMILGAVVATIELLLIRIGLNSILIITLGAAIILGVLTTQINRFISIKLWRNGAHYRKVCKLLNKLPKDIIEEREKQRENYNAKSAALGLSNYIDENYDLSIDDRDNIAKLSVSSCVNFMELRYDSVYSRTLEHISISDGDTPLVIDFEGGNCGSGFYNFKDIESKREIILADNSCYDNNIIKAIMSL